MSEQIHEFATEARLRGALVCTWHAFFARFPHLREVQKAAILPILKGESVVVNAPTASGKTEAIVAPVLERYLKNRTRQRNAAQIEAQTRIQAAQTAAKQPAESIPLHQVSGSLFKTNNKAKTTKGHVDSGQGPAILFVAPTKALCNDLYRRLLKPVEAVGLSISVRTGDNPNFKVDNPPDVVITTPESLDSLIARKPASFLYIEAIIIDEIHLIHASGRGDQLQCLLSRLRMLNKHPIQICASSATVPEIQRITRSFLGPEGRMISCPQGARDIRASIQIIHNDTATALDETVSVIESMLLESPTRKIIIFCNARANVENIVHALRARPRLASIVFAHHGSLSKDERLRTEQQFLRARNAACVATSTLELGIDIGDVDRIILIGPPPDVSSLIQRIGRGNRTQNVAHVCCLADCEFSAQRFLHLVECAKKELLFPDPVAFRPTTLVQQALSICLQNPQCWIGKQALYDRLAENAKAMYTLQDCAITLDLMVQNGLLRKVERGRYVPEAKTQFMFQRGYMHTMIADKAETDVVDSVTGRTIGSVYLRQSSKNAIAEGADINLTLGGNSHAVSYMKDKKLFVKRTDESTSLGFMALEPPRYSLALARDFAQFMHVPLDAFYIKCVPATLDLSREFTPRLGDELRPEFALPPEHIPPGYEFHIHHFLGTIGSLLIQNFFERNGNTVKRGSRSPFFLRLLLKPTITSFPDEERLMTQFEVYIRSNVQAFARLLQPGPWFNIVSEDMALRWLLESIDLRIYAKALANLPIILV